VTDTQKKFTSSRIASIFHAVTGGGDAPEKAAQASAPSQAPAPAAEPMRVQTAGDGMVTLHLGAGFGDCPTPDLLARLAQLPDTPPRLCLIDARAAERNEAASVKSLAAILRMLKTLGMVNCAILSTSSSLRMMLSSSTLGSGLKPRFFSTAEAARAHLYE
jgi:hypothetical protein